MINAIHIPPGAVAPRNPSGLGVGSHPSSSAMLQYHLPPPVAVATPIYPAENDYSDNSGEEDSETSSFQGPPLGGTSNLEGSDFATEGSSYSTSIPANQETVEQAYQKSINNYNNGTNDQKDHKNPEKNTSGPKKNNPNAKKNNGGVKTKKIDPNRQKQIDTFVLVDPNLLAANIEACSRDIESKKLAIAAQKNRLSEMKAAQKIQQKGPPKAGRIILKDLNPNELANIFAKYQKMPNRPFPMIVTLAVGRGAYTKQMSHLFPHDGYAHLDPGVVFTENERKLLDKFRVKIIHPGSNVNPFPAPVVSSAYQ